MELQSNYSTPGSHWEARIMLGDYMIAIITIDSMLSTLTLALLQDTGYWKIN